MKKNKIVGLIIGLAILCLSIGNAVTGHGIKGNENLNVEVLANETESGSGTGGIWDIPMWMEQIYVQTWYGDWEDAGPPEGRICRLRFDAYEIYCLIGGNKVCYPAEFVIKGEDCKHQ